MHLGNVYYAYFVIFDCNKRHSYIYIYLFRSKNCVAEYIRLHLKRYICLHYRNADLFLTAEAVKLIHLKLILKKLCENVYVF